MNFIARSIGIKNGGLYFHIFFLNIGGDLLPVITYYVVRNNTVFQVDPTLFKETPTGDDLAELSNCKDMGEYDKKRSSTMIWDILTRRN